MGNLKRGEPTKIDLIKKLEKLKGIKATSRTFERLRDDLKREVDYLEKKKNERRDYRKKLKEKNNE